MGVIQTQPYEPKGSPRFILVPSCLALQESSVRDFTGFSVRVQPVDRRTVRSVRSATVRVTRTLSVYQTCQAVGS